MNTFKMLTQNFVLLLAATCFTGSFFGSTSQSVQAISLNAPQIMESTTQPIQNIKQVSTGNSFTCALTTGGSVKCWGNNRYGKLGNGNVDDSLTPMAVGGLNSGIMGITTGLEHACALTSAGGVKCWGYNEDGELGNNSNVSTHIPVDVIGLNSDVSAISAGFYHTCALTVLGSVKCWGANISGVLGITTTILSSTVPIDVTELGNNIEAFTTGGYHTCALTTPGEVKCWGGNYRGQLGNNSTVNSSSPVIVTGLTNNIKSISAGDALTCALTDLGEVKCWGDDSYGQLGRQTPNFYSTIPIDINALNSGVTALSVGRSPNICVVTDNGIVKCWGMNSDGQLGNNSTMNSSTPVTVSQLSNITAVSTGLSHTCALTSLGSIECWGRNSNGQLGNNNKGNSFNPVDVISLSDNISFLGIGHHSCALTNAGDAKCWGDNFWGQLGDGSESWGSSTPVGVSDPNGKFKTISASINHTCAVTTNGVAKCWGWNSYGQLGIDSGGSRTPNPVAVRGLSEEINIISAGYGHTCALTISGGVKCWGWNRYGQLGNENTIDSSLPVTVTGLGIGVTSISVGWYHSCALMLTGTVKCWGRNSSGQLGNNASISSTVPVDVIGLNDKIQGITLGATHSCALMNNGAVKCWGDNSSGQLGNNSTTDSSAPVGVQDLNGGVSSISVGSNYSCALTDTGGVKCWGSNQSGQLGINDIVTSSIPIDVSGLSSGVKVIDAGNEHTCVLTNTNGVKCWGSNSRGQLGDDNAWKTIPVDVVEIVSVPSLASNNATVGAPGSRFILSGSNFQPQTSLPVSLTLISKVSAAQVNSRIGAVAADAKGNFTFTLVTSASMNVGKYQLEVGGTSTASIELIIESTASLLAPPIEGQLIEIDKRVFLPLIGR